jgi:nitrate/nitrite transport system substrate-binding protein
VGNARATGLAAAVSLGLALGGCGSSEADQGAAVAAANVDGAIEKPSLRIGFIKLTDMAPLAIAKEKGFFAEEGLNVSLEPQANWKVLLDGVIGGESLDGGRRACRARSIGGAASRHRRGRRVNVCGAHVHGR